MTPAADRPRTPPDARVSGLTVRERSPDSSELSADVSRSGPPIPWGRLPRTSTPGTRRPSAERKVVRENPARSPDAESDGIFGSYTRMSTLATRHAPRLALPSVRAPARNPHDAPLGTRNRRLGQPYGLVMPFPCSRSLRSPTRKRPRRPQRSPTRASAARLWSYRRRRFPRWSFHRRALDRERRLSNRCRRCTRPTVSALGPVLGSEPPDDRRCARTVGESDTVIPEAESVYVDRKILILTIGAADVLKP